MDIISYHDFTALRLENFIANPADIATLEDFEFMNDTWSGQALGFSEWLRSDADAGVRSISLDLDDLPEDSGRKILAVLQLRLSRGMTRESVIELFGDPVETENYIKDRVTYNYIVGRKEKYYLSLTIRNETGLNYVVITNHPEAINSLFQ